MTGYTSSTGIIYLLQRALFSHMARVKLKERKAFAGAFLGCSYNKLEFKNLICHYQSMITEDLIVKTTLAQKTCDV